MTTELCECGCPRSQHPRSAACETQDCKCHRYSKPVETAEENARYEPVRGRVIGSAKIKWNSTSMKHAIEILEERHCELRALLRQCCENSDRHMVGCGKQDCSGWLMELERAIECLRDAENKKHR